MNERGRKKERIGLMEEYERNKGLDGKKASKERRDQKKRRE